MKPTYQWSLPVTLVLLACATDVENPSKRTSLGGAEQVAIATERPTYAIVSPDVADSHLVGRARRLAEIVLGKALVDAPFQESLARSVADSSRSWDGRVDAVAPGLHVRYERSTDTLMVTNPEFESKIPEVENDPPASESAARLVFDAVIVQLEQAGFISASDYDLKNVHVGWTDYIVSTRSDEEPPEPRILNFRFSAPRMIDGLPFRDGRLRVAIHRSGRVASIKLRRAAVQLVQAGRSVPSKVSLPECEARFRREHPNGSVRLAQVAYVLPSPDADGVAEPKCVVSFSEVTPQPEGPPVVARQQQVRYSLADASAEPVVLPIHDLVPGDPRPSTEP